MASTNLSTFQPSDLQLVTWNVELSTYLSDRQRKLSHRSQCQVKQHVHVFALWYAAKFNQAFDPQDLTNYDLHVYRAWSLEQEKVSAATWNNRLWAFTHLCAWLGESSLLEGIEPKAQVRGSTKHRSLTDDEYHRLVHALEQNTRRSITQFEYLNAVRDWAAAMLMLHGLRVDECASVCSDDITLNERSGDVLVRSGKGDKERPVPINLIARNALRLWLSLRADSKTQTLFNVTVRTLQRNVSALGAQIGVPDLTCHWLRYTFAKRLERNATPIATIAELLGHEDIETTRRYLRSSLEELQSAVEEVM